MAREPDAMEVLRGVSKYAVMLISLALPFTQQRSSDDDNITYSGDDDEPPIVVEAVCV